MSCSVNRKMKSISRRIWHPYSSSPYTLSPCNSSQLSFVPLQFVSLQFVPFTIRSNYISSRYKSSNVYCVPKFFLLIFIAKLLNNLWKKFNNLFSSSFQFELSILRYRWHHKTRRFFFAHLEFGVYGVFDFKLNFEKNQLHFYGK